MTRALAALRVISFGSISLWCVCVCDVLIRFVCGDGFRTAGLPYASRGPSVTRPLELRVRCVGDVSIRCVCVWVWVQKRTGGGGLRSSRLQRYTSVGGAAGEDD